MITFLLDHQSILDLQSIKFAFFTLINWIPFILFQASAGAIFAAIIAFLRSIFKKADVQKF